MRGLQQGFHIGAARPLNLKSAETNMASAKQNPQVIEDYIQMETEAGNMFDPFPPQSIAGLHINRFGAIPKKYQQGKSRCLITDLSFPEGASVNDAINPALCYLSYVTLDEVAAAAMQLGQGALLAKIDTKLAY